jgi:hypothetical protein
MYRNIARYWKSFFCTIYKTSVCPGFAKQITSTLCILCYNGSLVTWTVVSLTTAKFKPLIFSTSGFALSYAVNMFILMILYDFWLLPWPAGPRDIASGRSQQKTPFLTIPLLLHDVTIRAEPQRTPFSAVLLLVTLRGVTYTIVAPLFTVG